MSERFEPPAKAANRAEQKMIPLDKESLLLPYAGRPWMKPKSPRISYFDELNNPVRDLLYFLVSRVAIEINWLNLGGESGFARELLERKFLFEPTPDLFLELLVMNAQKAAPEDLFLRYMEG